MKKSRTEKSNFKKCKSKKLAILCNLCSKRFCFVHYNCDHGCNNHNGSDDSYGCEYICAYCNTQILLDNETTTENVNDYIEQHLYEFCPVKNKKSFKHSCEFIEYDSETDSIAEEFPYVCDDCRSQFSSQPEYQNHLYECNHSKQPRKSYLKRTESSNIHDGLKKTTQDKNISTAYFRWTLVSVLFILIIVFALYLNTDHKDGYNELKSLFEQRKSLLNENSQQFQNMWVHFHDKYHHVLSNTNLLKIKHAISKSSLRPGVILLIGSDNDTTSCVARAIVNFVNKLIFQNSPTKSVFNNENNNNERNIINVSQFDGSEISQIFEENFEKLKNFVILLENFQLLQSSHMNPVFTYADEHNPKHVPAIIVLATHDTNIASVDLNEKELSTFVELFFLRRWADWREESATSMLSRITSTIVNVKPSKTCYGDSDF